MMPVAWLDRCRSCFLVTAKPGGGRRIETPGKAARCAGQICGPPVTPLWCTESWWYVRIHGDVAEPPPCYHRQALKSWAPSHLRHLPRQERCVCVLQPELGGAAIVDSAGFAPVAVASGRTVSTRRPVT